MNVNVRVFCTYLSSCHTLYYVGSVYPADKGDDEQCRNGCQVATVVERVGHPKKSSPEAEVDDKEESQENVDRLGLVGLVPRERELFQPLS